MKTIDQLREEEVKKQKDAAERKGWLAEKVRVAVLTPGCCDPDTEQEVIRLEALQEVLSDSYELYTGKIKIIERTNRWIEALPEP